MLNTPTASSNSTVNNGKSSASKGFKVYPFELIHEIKDAAGNITSDEIGRLIQGFENKYQSYYKSQVIVEFPNNNFSIDNFNIIKQELLTRSMSQDDIEVLLKAIEEGGDSFVLFCFMFQNCYRSMDIPGNNADTTFNVNVSDVLATGFINAVNSIKSNFSRENDKRITFEILEDQPVPINFLKRRYFFDKLKILKLNGFNIAIDDVGGVDKNGEVLNGDINRIKGFLKEGVLDVIKLDKLLVRQLYIGFMGYSENLDIAKATYSLDTDLMNPSKVIDEIGSFHKNLKQVGVKIVAEGIEDFDLGNGEKADVAKLIQFLKHEIGVDLFQGYGIGKPMNPEEIYGVAA